MNKSWRDSISNRHDRAREQGLWRTRSVLSSAQGVSVWVENKPTINFSSNDYLGLANHDALKQASAEACLNFGAGSGASHLVCGHLRPHHKLEEAIADFVGAQRALLFSNGYMANLSVTSAFLSKGDLLLQDKLNHASLIDGAKLSGAKFKRYAHCNLSHADMLIRKADFNYCMIASDSVFSMDGDIAPLNEINALATQYEALLLVDDAHGFGVLGDSGRGALNAAELSPSDNVLMMGTLGKALGCYGAFIAGDEVYIEHLIQSARPYIYTTALPPAVAASALAALNLIAKYGKELRGRLFSNIEYFKQGAFDLNLAMLPSSTAIQPILIGDAAEATRVSQALFNDGFNVVAIRPPTVASGTARLRIALSADHSNAQIDQLLESLARHIRSV